MQYLSLIPFLTLAAAAPNPTSTPPSPDTYENIDITDFSVRKAQGPDQDTPTIDAVSFKLSGDDATDLTCAASSPDFPSEVITCGESKYRFVLQPGTDGNEFGLTLYHELGPAFGYWGEGSVPTYCHAGGDGPNDFVCEQVPTTPVTTIVINSGSTDAE